MMLVGSRGWAFLGGSIPVFKKERRDRLMYQIDVEVDRLAVCGDWCFVGLRV